MDVDQTTRKALFSCAAAALVLVIGAFGFSVPSWQPGYKTVAPEPFDAQQMYQVELNSAGFQALCSLPGIGEKKAEAIIAYRQEHGPFSSIEELENVKGMSEKSIEALRSRLYIETDDMQKEER